MIAHPVSPGFMLRPSLSAPGGDAMTLDAFLVSPGFMLRPSLSGDEDGTAGADSQVSPGFMLRPSLSGRRQHQPDSARGARVAGVYAPAFVERYTKVYDSGRNAPCVAGVYAPAFVEREERQTKAKKRGCVAGVYAPAFVERLGALLSLRHYHPCRRGLCSGLR